MKMSYEKPEIEVRNYSLLQECITTSDGILDPDITPGPNGVRSEELFK